MHPKALTADQCKLLEKAGISYASLASTLNYAWTEGIRFDDAMQFHKYCYYHYPESAAYIRQHEFREITKKVYEIMAQKVIITEEDVSSFLSEVFVRFLPNLI